MDQAEYIDKLSGKISDAFNGNWANDNMGSVEELQDTQKLLVDGISTVIAILISRGHLNLGEIKSSLQNGYHIEGGD